MERRLWFIIVEVINIIVCDFILQFCIMPSDKRSPSFVFYVSKTKISDLVSCIVVDVFVLPVYCTVLAHALAYTIHSNLGYN